MDTDSGLLDPSEEESDSELLTQMIVCTSSGAALSSSTLTGTGSAEGMLSGGFGSTGGADTGVGCGLKYEAMGLSGLKV